MREILASDADAVSDALERLDQIIDDAPNDPIRYPLIALRTHLMAQQRMQADATASMNDAISKIQIPVINDDTVRFAVIQGLKMHAGGLLRTIRLATYMTGAGLLVCVFLAGYGLHWWMTPTLSFAGIRQGPDVCEQRSDGQLCRIPVFLPKQ